MILKNSQVKQVKKWKCRIKEKSYGNYQRRNEVNNYVKI